MAQIPQAAAIEHAIAVLRESAKQHRAASDPGHGRACDSAADTLDSTLSTIQRKVAERYFAQVSAS